jgi:G3E family GTPase
VIPRADVVTGPLGSGKTTVLAQQLAAKPAGENWVVLLNEFTAAGIDALTVAARARGRYDVRLVEGGCLCCTGEQDFRRNLADLVERVKPARIWVEPSGLGHPAGIVEELLGHCRAGRLEFGRVIALVDPERLEDARSQRDPLLSDQIGIADAVALSKADRAQPGQREAFSRWVGELYPRKVWSGAIARGELPAEALTIGHYARPLERGQRAATLHTDGVLALDWYFPVSLEFDEERLAAQLRTVRAGARAFAAPLRVKGVFRVADDRWVMTQLTTAGLEMSETSWRRDSRAEVLLPFVASHAADPTAPDDSRAAAARLRAEWTERWAAAANRDMRA